MKFKGLTFVEPKQGMVLGGVVAVAKKFFRVITSRCQHANTACSVITFAMLRTECVGGRHHR